jgi:hypothetical protein
VALNKQLKRELEQQLWLRQYLPNSHSVILRSKLEQRDRTAVTFWLRISVLA